MARTILIVDDEDLIRKMVSMHFERAGYTVFSADNGIDGLRLAEERIPDVTLLDINMPGMHGFEVCKKMRENPKLSKSLIIITSARSYKPDIDKAYELGADEYVIKPAGLKDLVGIVDTHISKKT
ncbi:MAG: response regulator [Bacteroidota bacterium]